LRYLRRYVLSKRWDEHSHDVGQADDLIAVRMACAAITISRNVQREQSGIYAIDRSSFELLSAM